MCNHPYYETMLIKLKFEIKECWKVSIAVQDRGFGFKLRVELDSP
jgi:hypothetical protein